MSVHLKTRQAKLENVKLVYWPARGRGDPMRLILEDYGVPYTEEHVPYPEVWETVNKDHKRFPFKQTPVFYANGDQVVQQDAIMRYITRVLRIEPQNFRDETISDILAGTVEDLAKVYAGGMMMADKNMEDGMREVLTTRIPEMFQQWERLLTQTSGGRSPPAFIEGPNPAFAEYMLFVICEFCTTLRPSVLDATPLFKAWFEAFGQRKGIREFNKSGRRLNQWTGWVEAPQKKLLD